jgi:hypothetical protein
MADIDKLIEGAKEKVRSFLPDVDPDFQEYDTGMFTIQEGSALIGITVRPWYENDVAVEFNAQLVSDATIDADAMKWLLQKNAELHFGSFGLLFDDTINYSHTLPAAALNESTFIAAARTIARIADHYDDEIRALTGGKLAGAETEPNVA